MGTLIFCVTLLIAVAMAEENKPHYDLNKASDLFETFISNYNKKYKDEADKRLHYRQFIISLSKINKMNSEQSTSTFDINKLSDFTPEEMKYMNGFFPPKPRRTQYTEQNEDHQPKPTTTESNDIENEIYK